MNSGAEGAEVVHTCLATPDLAPAALKRFEKMMRWGPSVFSWFIYRVTNPTMRELFMYPRNTFRMKNAILSVLAGDIFGKTPIWGSLRAFKAVYYIASLMNLRRTAAAMRQHAVDVRPVAPDA
jgi:hypothetical protein